MFQFWAYRRYDDRSEPTGARATRTIKVWHSREWAQAVSVQQGKQVKQLDRVIIRFAGDSGDGMQLTGDRFTQESAAFGNDLVTLPNFPAEIRAPRARSRVSPRSRCTSPTTTS